MTEPYESHEVEESSTYYEDSHRRFQQPGKRERAWRSHRSRLVRMSYCVHLIWALPIAIGVLMFRAFAYELVPELRDLIRELWCGDRVQHEREDE